MEKDNITQFPQGGKRGDDNVTVDNEAANAQNETNAEAPKGASQLVNAERKPIIVENPKVLELIKTYKEDKTVENLNLLVNELVKATIILPAHIRETDNKPAPALMQAADGTLYLGLFTDKDQIPEDKRTDMAIVCPYILANKTAINPQDNMSGLVINPYTDNFVLKRELLERIDEIETKKAEARKMQEELRKNQQKGLEALSQFGQIVTDENGNKALKMNETQYNQFERTQYEVGFLPGQLFTKGQEFIDKLLEDRETYIDELYEESYKQKRMYPYIPEDFAVMPLSLSDDLTLVRVDMPSRDIAFGNAYRVYIGWDAATSKGRYFRIAQGRQRGQIMLEEVCENKMLRSLGPAPEEGTELNAITELLGYKNPEE